MGPWLPAPSLVGSQGQVGRRTRPTSGKHQASRTCQGPEPGLREGEGSQGAPPPHTHTSQAVSAGAEEGPGLAPSPAPPTAGFHPQIWPRVPRGGNLANLMLERQGDDPVSQPKARRRRREDRRTRNG